MVNKPIYGRDFDRDKNLTYRPQDESGDLEHISPFFAPFLKPESVVNIIIRQHQELREYSHVIKNAYSTSAEKQRALLDFVGLWLAHARAEENTLYEEVTFSSECKPMLEEAYEEHAIAQILIEELEALNFRLSWNTMIQIKAQALAEVVEDHLKNEEDSYLKLILDLLPQADLQLLGREFTRQFEATAAHNKVSLKPSRVLS
ncbi:MAG: hemerythrin domain-containing protein [Bdellovibrionota bacterium]